MQKDALGKIIMNINENWSITHLGKDVEANSHLENLVTWKGNNLDTPIGNVFDNVAKFAEHYALD